MKSRNNSSNVGDTVNFETLLPNGKVVAIAGRVARDIIGAMRNALEEIPSVDCKGTSGVSQHRGAPSAESKKAQSLGQLATMKNGRCRAFLLGAICVAR
jgi:hypothetical protein